MGGKNKGATSMSSKISESIIVLTLRLLTLLYDVLTFPVYLILQKPWRRLRDHKESKSQPIAFTPTTVTYRSTTPITKIHVEMETQQIDTMDKMFAYAVKRNGTKRCLGTRQILREEDELQSNQRLFKKYVLGNYIWNSYKKVDQIAENLSKGLRKLGMEPTDKICIYAETRAEWLMAAIGCFKQNFIVVTLYATLGEEAVQYGLNETEARFVLTSHELVPKIRAVIKNCPHVTNVIYMEDPLHPTDTTELGNTKVHAFCDVVEIGKSMNIGPCPPGPDSTAIIMYTSGSTGNPKGVLLSHYNILQAMLAFCDGLGTVYKDDVYIGYLPLAHVLELMCEAIAFLSGIPIGYSSPLTMTDTSSKIKRGCKGDSAVLRPTIIMMVPLIVDRISKGIQEKVSESGAIGRAVFRFFYDYRLKWYYRGFKTPVVDKIVFKKLRKLIGGKIRIIACGGAPLCAETHEFIRNCLCAPLVQGYGLTETSGCASITVQQDMSIGRVGVPFNCSDIRLINWEEGNYTVKDKPFPRGEVLIGGNNVAMGYYNLEKQTAEDFFAEGDTRRWFRSGDIGEMQGDGVLRIIDRKKDLVKLQHGEYVSLGKVESELKTSALIENICVYADSTKNYCVAVVVPALKQITNLAEKLGKPNLSLEEMCSNSEIEANFLKELQAHGRKCKLLSFEIPNKVALCWEVWTPDMGLVTAAFKLKRRNIQDRFQNEISRMYA